MKYLKNGLAFIGLLALAGLLMQAVTHPGKDTMIPQFAQQQNDTVNVVGNYNIKALPIPDHIDFAGETVPMENPDIRRRMDREILVNAYWQSNGLILLKRANQYFPIIEPILEEHGIPDDFKYLAIAESGLDQVISPAGATGFWQFMKDAGKEYGLEVNANVDERYHIEKATHAACKYLKESKEKFGTWTLAAATYNAGKNGIKKQQKRQDVEGYYDLLLGPETSRYVFRILALKEILSHPKKYGFNFTPDDLYHEIPTQKVKVDTAITDMAQFAKNFGINYKILKLHNPWLREAHLDNKKGRSYDIKIPEEGYYTYKP